MEKHINMYVSKTSQLFDFQFYLEYVKTWHPYNKRELEKK